MRARSSRLRVRILARLPSRPADVLEQNLVAQKRRKSALLLPLLTPIGSIAATHLMKRTSHSGRYGSFCLVEIQFDPRVIGVVEEQLPRAPAGELPQIVRNASRFELGECPVEVDPGEGHMIDDTLDEHARILAGADVQDGLVSAARLQPGARKLEGWPIARM